MIGLRVRTSTTNSPLKNPIRRFSVRTLEFLDLVVYSLVGVAFFAAAAFALGYSVLNVGKIFGIAQVSPDIAQAVLDFVSDLLLVLIIMEVLGTVRSYLEKGDTSVKPFLFIGIISATRGILSIGARLSITVNQNQPATSNSPDDFTRSMIELGVNAFIIIALGATLRIMGTYATNKDEEPEELPTKDNAVLAANHAQLPEE